MPCTDFKLFSYVYYFFSWIFTLHTVINVLSCFFLPYFHIFLEGTFSSPTQSTQRFLLFLFHLLFPSVIHNVSSLFIPLSTSLAPFLFFLPHSSLFLFFSHSLFLCLSYQPYCSLFSLFPTSQAEVQGKRREAARSPRPYFPAGSPIPLPFPGSLSEPSRSKRAPTSWVRALLYIYLFFSGRVKR